MASTIEPKGSFRLSQLIYDTRYRSLTFQVIALIAFMAGAAWLVNNALTNLALSGKPLGFDFLGTTAGYDINQRLIDYTSQSSHLRALFVGLLNTLLVAVLGCITATFIGVFVGILRLSNNWLISRLMTFYVEIFRNVPVLLWILFSMAIFIEVLPQPREFRGDNATASMFFSDSVAFTNRGFYVPEPLFANSLGNIDVFGAFFISIDLLVILAALIGGILGARWVKKNADAVQESTGVRPTTWWKRLGLIFGPVILVLLALGFHLGYPELKGFNFKGGIYMRNSLLALWFALSLYTAAFIAEIVRGGIMAISQGQSEAAASLGLRPNRIMSLVILPQALRVMIPPMISNYLNLTKNSSLAIAVGYMDLTGTLGGITLNQTGREMECLILLMAVYLIISLSISAVLNWYNESVKLRER